jgi:hypothetical protein
MGPLPKAKFGASYPVSVTLNGARTLGSVVPAWAAAGAVSSVPTDAAGVTATIAVPPNAIGGMNFQLTVTAILPGSPPITVSESQSISLTF